MRTRHITRDEFLRALDQNGRALFERVLEFARDATPEMAIRWGNVGFSMNLDVDGSRVPLLEGYPPTSSAYKQAIYTTRSSIVKRTEVPEEELAGLWNKAQATGLFQAARNELKCPIDHIFTGEEIQQLLNWFGELAATIAKYGMK